MRRMLVVFVAITCASLVALAGPAGAAVTADFFFGGNASAGWTTITPVPPGDPDTRSIALSVNGDNGSDFDDFAGFGLLGIDNSAPATPPSYDFQSSVTDAGTGGSPRLVIAFSDGGNLQLRPLSWTAGAWVTIDGTTNLWDNSGGTCGFLFATTYATGLACHPATTVTDVFVVSDSGWFHPGGYTHYIDNVSYDGALITADGPVAGPPKGPTVVTATPGPLKKQITVGWNTAQPNGSPVTSYTATCAPTDNNPSLPTKTTTVGPARRSTTIGALVAGARYSCSVHATNANGNGTEVVSSPLTVAAKK